MIDPFARAQRAADNPWGYQIDQLEGDLDRVRTNWGTRSGTMGLLAPELLADRDLAQRFMRYERQSASPGMARAMIGWMYEIDVRHVLPTIRVPTLVLHHREAKRIPIEHGATSRRGSRAHSSSSSPGPRTTLGAWQITGHYARRDPGFRHRRQAHGRT